MTIGWGITYRMIEGRPWGEMGEVTEGTKMKYSSFFWLTPTHSSELNLNMASSGRISGPFGPGQVSMLHVPKALYRSPLVTLVKLVITGLINV